MPIALKERPIFMIGAAGRDDPRHGNVALSNAHLCSGVIWYYSRFRPYLHTYGDLSQDANFRTLAEEMVFGLKTPFWGMKVNPRTIVDEILSSVRERSFAGLYCAMFERYAKQDGDKPR